MYRSRVTALLLACVLVFASACEPETSSGSGLPKRAPGNPPATQAVRPKTPAPIAGDPKPENKRKVYLRVACAPLDEFVSIEWQAGPAHGGHVPEKKCFPAFEKTVEVWAPASVTFSARWTEISFRDMERKHVTGNIQLLIKVDNEIKCDVQTLSTSAATRRGVQCPLVTITPR